MRAPSPPSLALSARRYTPAHTSGGGVADVNKPVCADIGQEEDRRCYLRLHPCVTVQGTTDQLRKLCELLCEDRDKEDPLYHPAALIEDSLEPGAGGRDNRA